MNGAIEQQLKGNDKGLLVDMVTMHNAKMM